MTQVMERSLTLPAGLYRNSDGRYEIRHSARGHWYAIRQEPDGSTTYVAQDVDPASLSPSGRRSVSDCTHCTQPATYNSGLCPSHERQRCASSWQHLTPS